MFFVRRDQYCPHTTTTTNLLDGINHDVQRTVNEDPFTFLSARALCRRRTQLICPTLLAQFHLCLCRLQLDIECECRQIKEQEAQSRS